VVIRTSAGTVLHTGRLEARSRALDRRGHDEARLRAIATGVLFATSAISTNALKPASSGSEGELRHSLTELIGRYDSRVGGRLLS